MSTREKFELEMQHVQEDLLELADHALAMFQLTFEAFINKNTEQALYVMDQDYIVNRLEEEINDKAILLIAKQQPVATDLRRLIVMVKMAADLERIADYAVNIAKETIRIGANPFVTSIETIEEMHHRATCMLKQIVEAYRKEKMDEAKTIASYDDEIDALYGDTMRHLFNIANTEQAASAQVTNLSFVAHYIERVADHVTNLAEHLLYLKKGKHYELNN